MTATPDDVKETEIWYSWYSSKNFKLLNDNGFDCVWMSSSPTSKTEKLVKTFDSYFEKEYRCPRIIENECFILCNNCNNVLVKLERTDAAKIISDADYGFSTCMYLKWCIKQELKPFIEDFRGVLHSQRYIKINTLRSNFRKPLDWTIHDTFENVAVFTHPTHFLNKDTNRYKMEMLFCCNCLTGPFGIYGVWTKGNLSRISGRHATRHFIENKRSPCYIIMSDDIKLCKSENKSL